MRVAGSAEVGAFPEGVAFAPDGRHVYVGNYRSDSISILEITRDGKLANTGESVRLPGPPASLRIGAQ